MSKFIDRLNRLAQATPQPIGFRQTQLTSEKPKMLLVASLNQADLDRAADYVAGADAGLLHIPELSPGTENIQRVSRMVPDIPWGGRLRGIGQGEIKQMVKAGCDFVVFPAADTSLAMLQDDEVGKILEVEVSLSDSLLGTVNELPIDAVLIASEKKENYPLTWHHLMLFRRFANLLTKPLLASAPANITANELKALWEAGVDSVIIKVGGKQPATRINKLQQAIDKLVFPPQRKRGKRAALLPHISGDTGIVTEEEEEEEEEEDL